MFIDERWVLTAAHCSDGSASGDAAVLLNADGACSEWRIEGRFIKHPDLDAVAVELAEALPEEAHAIAPVTFAAELPSHVVLGTDVLLSGFGLDGEGGTGRRTFLVEPISQIEPTTLTVQGAGRTGACLGDSGGPLLHRDGQTGAPLVLGLLSRGAPSCREEDVYIRVDALSPWLAGLGIRAKNADRSQTCGEVDQQGRCLGSLRVACEAGTLVAETCQGSTPACSYNRELGRYGCMPNHDGPCGALDQTGTCEGSTAHLCQNGEPTTVRCSGETDRCERDPATAVAHCVGE